MRLYSMARIFNINDQKDRRKELRRNITLSEKILWTSIRNRKLKYKFRRQYGIGNYIVDFYCPEIKLAIEIDGDSHCFKNAIDYDKNRTKYFNDLGIKVVRYTNNDIKNNLQAVLDDLIKICGIDLTSP